MSGAALPRKGTKQSRVEKKNVWARFFCYDCNAENNNNVAVALVEDTLAPDPRTSDSLWWGAGKEQAQTCTH